MGKPQVPFLTVIILCHAPRHRRRDVRPKDQGISLPVKEFVHLLGGNGSFLTVKDIEKFKSWGNDILVTVEGKDMI